MVFCTTISPHRSPFLLQVELERRMMSGANKSKERDTAIANLIRVACSEEFKKLVG